MDTHLAGPRWVSLDHKVRTSSGVGQWEGRVFVLVCVCGGVGGDGKQRWFGIEQEYTLLLLLLAQDGFPWTTN